MGWIIGLLVEKGMSAKGARILAEGALVLLVCAVLGGIVLYIRHDAVGDYKAKLEQRAAPAKEKAAEQRTLDAVANARDLQETRDAIQAQPDQPISPTSRALGCKRLHDLGRDSPACR